MIIPKETDSIIIGGNYYVGLLTSFLIERSAWFCVEPLPDNEWQIYYKPEQDKDVKKFVKYVICIRGWKIDSKTKRIVKVK